MLLDNENIMERGSSPDAGLKTLTIRVSTVYIKGGLMYTVCWRSIRVRLCVHRLHE